MSALVLLIVEMVLGMSFKLLHESINYVEYCKAVGSNGLCFGQSWLWLSDIITGASGSLIPPDFHKGAVIHQEYREVCSSPRAYVGYVKQKASVLKLKFPERGLQLQSADDYDSSVKLINQLPACSVGNAVILMSWGLNEKTSTLKKVVGWHDAGHAMVLLKLKHNGLIYLFDANKGVFIWIRTSGVELKTDVKRLMLESGRFSMAAMTDSIMLSTQSDIPLNFEHVVV